MLCGGDLAEVTVGDLMTKIEEDLVGRLRKGEEGSPNSGP